MTEVRVPELGESITEASILRWYKQAGDQVQEGEALAELETDKVNIEVIAEQSGAIAEIVRQAGETVGVNEIIAVIASTTTEAAQSHLEEANRGDTAQPNARDAETSVSGSPAQSTPSLHQPTAVQDATSHARPSSDVEAAKAPTPIGSDARDWLERRATPSLRRKLREQNVSGQANDELVEESMESPHPVIGSMENRPMESRSVDARSIDSRAIQAPSNEVRSDEERVNMTRRRLTIAHRLVETQNNAAMLTTFNEIDMTNVLEVRKRNKERFKEEHQVNLGFMSFFTKATVSALRKFPYLNAEIQGETIVLKHHYDIGVAVSTEGGLVVPVVRDANQLNFSEIEESIATLAERARSNKLGISDLQGGTFTITNGGVFGSLFSTPILNGPQVGILGMHGIQKRPVAIDDQVEIRPMMYVALSYDHRIVDGREAVSFLVHIKKLIENPELLLLET